MSSVFVVDGDADLRETLVSRLRDAGLRGRGFAAPDALFDAIHGEELACVVADVSPSAMDGAALIRRLSGLKGEAWGVVAVSEQASVSQVVQLMKLGAADFIEKPCEPDRILEAALACVSRLERGAGRRAMRARSRGLHQTLTERERQVFDGLVAGQTNRTIARDLAISIRTVENFRGRVMHKMRADNLPALIRLAMLLEE